MKNIGYHFKYTDNCNMYGASIAQCKHLGRRLNASQGWNPCKKAGITTSIFRCKQCGLIFSNPMPIPLDINDHYGVLPEEYWKNEYFKDTANYFETELKRLRQFMPDFTNKKSLDIGAGLGKGIIAMQQAGFDAYGIEPSPQFYERALQNKLLDKSKLILSSIEKADFPNNYFDFISFGAVLEHLYDPNACIKKALHWCKPGGIIHIQVPSANWLISRLINTTYKLRCIPFVTNLSPMHPPYHLYEFTLHTFQQNATKNHYVVADFDNYICETYLPKIFDFPLQKWMKFTKSGMILTVWLRKLNRI